MQTGYKLIAQSNRKWITGLEKDENAVQNLKPI